MKLIKIKSFPEKGAVPTVGMSQALCWSHTKIIGVWNCEQFWYIPVSVTMGRKIQNTKDQFKNDKYGLMILQKAFAEAQENAIIYSIYF